MLNTAESCFSFALMCRASAPVSADFAAAVGAGVPVGVGVGFACSCARASEFAAVALIAAHKAPAAIRVRILSFLIAVHSLTSG